MEPNPIPLIKSKNDEKPDKDCVQIKFCRYPTSENSELYEFKMAPFDNGNPVEFLLFIRSFQITIEASVRLSTSTKTQYLCTLVRGEALLQIDMLSTVLPPC